MALQGTIQDFGLADIFQLIGIQRKTGTLVLDNGERVSLTTPRAGTPWWRERPLAAPTRLALQD